MINPKLHVICKLVILAGFVVVGQTRLLLSEEAAKPTPEPKNLREFIDASIQWYQVFPSVDASTPAEPITVLRWANNTRGSEDGTTLLYVHDGQPVAAACIYPWAQRLEHDFESLSRRPLVARRNGVTVWEPERPGVTYADIPGAPLPEATRPQRLRQIKALAGRFQGTMAGWKVDSSDREELRLLPRPLFRYEPKSANVIDGAVLAFVMGTDPEILLLIEAVRDGDKAKWQYAFARRTSGRLEGRLDGTLVWEADLHPQQHNHKLPHFTTGVPLPPAIVDEANKAAEKKP